MYRQIIRKNLPLITKSYGRNFATACNSPKIAVVLSGCGYLDGSEIHETVAVLSHLTRHKAVPHCFAPNIDQFHVINHCSQEEDKEDERNVMIESARIARHPVQPLCKLVEDSDCFEAVIFPGGFGVAKNLCDFAVNGVDMEVLPDVEKVLKTFCSAGKPIGALCISPILIAKVFPCATITFGKDDDKDKWPYRDVISAAKQLGAVVEYRNWDDVSVDHERKIVSSPAYMYDGEYHEIYDSVGKLVKYVLSLATRRP